MLQLSAMWKKLSPKTREFIKKTISVILPIFSVLFIVSTTILIIVVMKGYSIDINKKEIIKTGVLNVETYPRGASILINNEYHGKSNKAIPNLKIGNYAVSLSKDNYFDYIKTVNIEHGLASPVIIPLIKRSDRKLVIKDLSDTIVEKSKDSFFLLQKRQKNNQYELKKITTSKIFLDDPEVDIKEPMFLNISEETEITGMNINKQGTSILINIKNTSGNTSVALITYKEGSTKDLDKLSIKSLNHYVNNPNNIIHWTPNPEYLLVETKTQIISYNITTGTRIILLEKDNILENETNYLWDATENGILVLEHTEKKGKKEDLFFKFRYLSYSGTPLELELPQFSLDSLPTNLWAQITEQSIISIVSTKKQSHLIGKLYSSKTGEYSITSGNSIVGTKKIINLENGFSQIIISNTPITSRPLFLQNKHTVAFLQNEDRKLTLFSYNKRAANAMSILGTTELINSETTINNTSKLLTEHYVSYVKDKEFTISDFTGENIYMVESNVLDIVFSKNDAAMLFITTENALYFRVLQ